MDNTKYNIEQQRVLSLCYGYGGLERGVSAIIPIKPVAYLEIEAFQNFNLVAAMESGLVDSAPIWTDIKTFDAKPFHNKVHGIIGGYPCQGESLAGKRKLWNDDRFLYPYIERIIDTVRPFWCFFENVEGHLSGTFPYVLDSLQKLGYQVEAGLFSVSEVGAPHQRKRLFILAIESELVNSNFFGLGNDKKEYFQTKNNEIRKFQISQQIGNNIECRIMQSGNSELGYSESSNQQWDFEQSGASQKPSGRYGKNVSYSDSFGSIESEQGTKSGQFSKNGNYWPSNPGQQQKEWEHPRTIKSGLGCTVNGYNFRTELLRQYGNGVVSQTAALAFETLLKKINKHENHFK